MTGENEDTRIWRIYATEANGYIYLYAINLWAVAGSFRAADAANALKAEDRNEETSDENSDWYRDNRSAVCGD
ncbi:MAG: hypothetical protein ACI4AB_06335 [Acetatifactor sp.]